MLLLRQIKFLLLLKFPKNKPQKTILECTNPFFHTFYISLLFALFRLVMHYKYFLMKTLIFFFVLNLLINHAVYAQSSVNDKITEVYGADFVTNNPTLVRSFDKLLTERIRYEQQPETADEKFPKISTLGLNNKRNPSLTMDTVFDAQNFNPLKYGMQLFAPTTQVYRFDNTDILIIIEPQK